MTQLPETSDSRLDYTCPRCGLEHLTGARDQAARCAFCAERARTYFQHPKEPTEDFPAGRQAS